MDPLRRIAWVGRLAFAGWILVAGLALAWQAASFLYERDVLIAQAYQRVHSRAGLAAEHAARLFEGTDVALRSVGNLIGEKPDWNRIAASESEWQRLARSKEGLPTVSSISIADGTGAFRFHSEAFPVPVRSVADRAYFAFHREDSRPVPFFHEAVRGRVSGRPVMIMSRRLAQADNAFVGIAFAAIRQDIIEQSFATLIQSPGDHITLVRLDGTVLLRHPPAEEAIGRKIPIGDWVFQALAAGKQGGTVEKASPIDGVTRIFAVRKVGDYDLITVAGQSKDELLLDWRNRLIATLAAMLAGILLLTLGLMGLLRAYRQEATAKRVAEETGEQLRRTVEELTHSNAELERFAFVAAHDLQEPLRNVVTYSQIIERDLGSRLTDGERQALAILVEGARRMRMLVGDLLAYSRVSSRGERFQALDASAAVQLALANLKEAVDESEARICVGDLPKVSGDQTQVALLFQNLIGNAIKYRRSGTRPQIDIRAERQGGHWLFSVADDGIGIDPRYAEQVFVIFKRLHTAERYPGTGLGLALCRRIVERHGGRIWMESPGEGQGTTIRFTLPVQAE